jgi:tetratricopeptide (TPR) repeat protein
MKFAIALALSLLLNPSILFAQQQPQNLSPASPKGTQTILLNGKVLTEANSPPAESVNVGLQCGGKEEIAQAHTDSAGYFSITVQLTDSASTPFPPRNGGRVLSATELESCELSAKVPGYTAEPLHITRGGDIGMINAGTILLRSVVPKGEQTFAVSVTSLAAPDKAKAAFEKGEEQSKKGKWSAAIDSFKKAIAVYPKYALAWLELGRVQAKQSDFTNARQSFHESINQDSKLSDGYVELARLALRQQQWNDLASATDHLVQVHPEVAEFWFLNSAASFNLGNATQAEAGITRGIRLDSAHRVPQMEYLYGLILARSQKYQLAAEHVSTYLKLSPQAPDAQEAQKRLTQLQELAAQASVRK